MNQEEFNKVLGETAANIRALMETKGREYAEPDDRLGNFKRGAALTGATPLQVAFIYASKHYDSIASYVRGGLAVELSEPIGGRLDDLINYCILMKAIIAEDREYQSSQRNMGDKREAWRSKDAERYQNAASATAEQQQEEFLAYRRAKGMVV